MINIDFFGCSFTQNSKDDFRASRPILLSEYAEHSHITKVISNFLEFDLAYNDNSDYVINNFGRGSYGNFTIGKAIQNRVTTLNKQHTNIALVQLSAILRNEQSLKTILGREEEKSVLKFNYDDIKLDYILDDNTLFDFYTKHVSNIENICDNLSNHYNKFILFFGWDATTSEFIDCLKNSNAINHIIFFDYDYELSEIKYFGNWDSFDKGKYKGYYGGMLEYASNKLVEEIRYCSENDHHPSYFSNKIFYKDIIRNFLVENTNLNLKKDLFDNQNIKDFENFLVSIIAGKYKGGQYVDYSYEQLHKLITNNIKTKTI